MISVGRLANGLLVVALAVLLYLWAQREEYLWFESVLADDIGTAPITRDEADALRSLRRRRQARRAARRHGGRASGRLIGRLQREQIGYAIAKARAPEVERAPDIERRGARIRELREQLATTAAQPHPRPEPS